MVRGRNTALERLFEPVTACIRNRLGRIEELIADRTIAARSEPYERDSDPQSANSDSQDGPSSTIFSNGIDHLGHRRSQYRPVTDTPNTSSGSNSAILRTCVYSSR